MAEQIVSNKKVVLITGCSSGFGELTAQTLAAAGYCVFAAMRDPARRNREAAEALRQRGGDVEVIDLDVTDALAIDSAVGHIIKSKGRIDVLINNAGVMNVGVTEGYTPAQLQRQMDVNFFGPAQLDRAVIPHMREQQSGLLIHVTSLAGRMVFPYFGTYCASKFALEALAEAYRYELSAQGIDSIVVEPGPFATDLIGNSPKPADEARLAAYGDTAALPYNMLESFEAFYQSEDAVDPQVVADDIARLIETPTAERPMRTVSGLDYGLRDLNTAVGPIQRGLLEALGLSGMDPTPASVSTTVTA